MLCLEIISGDLNASGRKGRDFEFQFTTVAEKLDRVRTVRTGASSLSCPSAMGLYVCHQVHGSQLTVLFTLHNFYACFNCAAGTHISLNYAWSRGCPWSLALVVVFVPLWAPYFSTRGCISGKCAPRVLAGGDLILHAAELRAPFPSFTVF